LISVKLVIKISISLKKTLVLMALVNDHK